MVGDVGEPAVQDALIAAAPACDILINNNGGPPPRDFRQVDRAALEAGIAANMATPIALVQRVIDGMIERGWGRIVCITSASVKAPVGRAGPVERRAARADGFPGRGRAAGGGVGVTINFLLPGAVRHPPHRRAPRRRRRATGKSRRRVRDAARWRRTRPAGLGRPAEFGAACAFLCSAHAGYITGQSLLMDGGAFPGTL